MTEESPSWHSLHLGWLGPTKSFEGCLEATEIACCETPNNSRYYEILKDKEKTDVGFNGGDPYVAGLDASLAVLNTHVCAAASLLTCIPHNAVAGTLGAILAGVLANPRLSRIFHIVDDWPKYIGLAYGIQSGRFNAGLRQLWVQLIGIGFVFVWNVVSTSVICLIIRMMVPLRMTEEEVSGGDNAVHGEETYALWDDGEKFDNSKLQLVHEIEEPPLSKSGYGL
ncbi:hypothetical protein RND71_024461 [Anisodus tanguticus]|uniref:Ammonium transporter AmtB-like domain-containing protein n=1 Tax=Anisodus tanguticus TaxID=243964 RepID=A0AAE1RNB8_9SOLA|nr:hypothetical protein RND71_024461 [Anisodus tanguticus]